jgi:hypothetical protein
MSHLKVASLFRCAILVLSVLMSWLANGAQAAAEDEPPKAAAAAASFELLVVGPNGTPLPEAHVEIRTVPRLEAQHILKGR